MTASGKDWVTKYPTSDKIQDLLPPFQKNAERFINSLKAAGAEIEISATYRPKERAYLMHYAYRIARQNFDPRQVPSFKDVDIDWAHKNDKGAFDLAASRNAAEVMVQAYGIVFKPALNSNHTRGLAIDMSINWSGTLQIIDSKGNKQSIATAPRNGQNATLQKVAQSYGVLKMITDPPHWSIDGR